MTPRLGWRIGLGVVALCLGIGLAVSGVPWGRGLGEDPKLKELVAVFFPLGLLVALGVVVLLFVVCPWWAGHRVTPGMLEKKAAPRWFWPCVMIAMAASAFFSYPRLTHSLWDDEEYNVRYSIVGKYQIRKGDEPLKFHRAKWMDTLFEYREPNNHVLHSILARVCIDTWRAVARPSGLPFVEWPLRLPGFLAGILSIAAIAWFLKAWGMPGAGVLAAILMALHPWHMRYVAECRGYGMALLLIPLLFGLWRFALCDGRWRWWAALGAVQFAIVYTYPGAAFVLAVLNLIAVPTMRFGQGLAGPFIAQSGRWFCTNAWSALPALVLMMPLVPQMRSYLEYESSRNMVIGAAWIWNTGAHFIAGTGWTKNSTPEASYPEVLFLLGGHTWIYLLILGFAGLLFFTGCRRMLQNGLPGWMVVLATVLPPIATVAFARARGHLIYESYVIYALPGFVALVSIGAVWLTARMLPGPRKQWVRLAVLVAMVVAFGMFTHSTRAWMRQNSLQPIKESVLASRGTLNPDKQEDPSLITASFSIPPYLYDPRALRLESTREFVDLILAAEAAGRPLTVNLGMPWAARAYSPAMWELVNNPELFENPKVLRGFDPGLDRMLFDYRPGSATSFDFSDWLDRRR